MKTIYLFSIIVFLIALTVLIYNLYLLGGVIGEVNAKSVEVFSTSRITEGVRPHHNSADIVGKWCNYYLVDQKECDHIRATIQCESQFNPNAYNPADPITPSVGIAQFKHRTFNYFKSYFGLDKLNINNPDDQIRLMVVAIAEGQGHHWTCYK